MALTGCSLRSQTIPLMWKSQRLRPGDCGGQLWRLPQPVQWQSAETLHRVKLKVDTEGHRLRQQQSRQHQRNNHHDLPIQSVSNFLNFFVSHLCYRLCGLVIRVPGCRHRGPGFGFRRYQIFWVAVDLEQGPHSLVRINERLLERKVAAPV
jgi:hypothetical protein